MDVSLAILIEANSPSEAERWKKSTVTGWKRRIGLSWKIWSSLSSGNAVGKDNIAI